MVNWGGNGCPVFPRIGGLGDADSLQISGDLVLINCMLLLSTDKELEINGSIRSFPISNYPPPCPPTANPKWIILFFFILYKSKKYSEVEGERCIRPPQHRRSLYRNQI